MTEPSREHSCRAETKAAGRVRVGPKRTGPAFVPYFGFTNGSTRGEQRSSFDEHGDCCNGVAAATFVVGDSNGWNLGVEGWPNGKVFRAGDILTPRGTKVFNSGNDEIMLSTGHSFFICTTPGHSQAGMKIAINSL
ncbi:basic blue protein-like [Cucurbita pepo subsp. pepo]|uniref:basic blue protein-like n=1 Tax=Cucurbita pepo subsp. pepo TaxID=3664 RepID=UPI000C9D74C9|nr:basic blue protein-like [Cucurbita pepo subsp. pepo]